MNFSPTSAYAKSEERKLSLLNIRSFKNHQTPTVRLPIGENDLITSHDLIDQNEEEKFPSMIEDECLGADSSLQKLKLNFNKKSDYAIEGNGQNFSFVKESPKDHSPQSSNNASINNKNPSIRQIEMPAGAEQETINDKKSSLSLVNLFGLGKSPRRKFKWRKQNEKVPVKTCKSTKATNAFRNAYFMISLLNR